MRLPRAFYARESKIVTKELLGKILVHKTSEGTYKGKIFAFSLEIFKGTVK